MASSTAESSADDSDSSISWKRTPNFIKRNIKMAAMGAVTDDEKLKLEELLQEDTEPMENVYKLDDETSNILREIDSKLQGLRPLSPNTSSDERETKTNSGRKEMKSKQRLQKIEDALVAMSTEASEEIHPIEEEKMQLLLQQSSGEEHLEDDVMAWLVEDTRNRIPHFKFRFT